MATNIAVLQAFKLGRRLSTPNLKSRDGYLRSFPNNRGGIIAWRGAEIDGPRTRIYVRESPRHQRATVITEEGRVRAHQQMYHHINLLKAELSGARVNTWYEHGYPDNWEEDRRGYRLIPWGHPFWVDGEGNADSAYTPWQDIPMFPDIVIELDTYAPVLSS